MSFNVYYTSLLTRQYEPTGPRQGKYVVELYLANRDGPKSAQFPQGLKGLWTGDGFLASNEKGKYNQIAPQKLNMAEYLQYRERRQSRMFITYSLHTRVTNEETANKILSTMKEAVLTLFSDKWLPTMLRFGVQLADSGKTDAVSRAVWIPIPKTRKLDRAATFYSDTKTNSYIHDTYQTHVDGVEVDGGVEIGPKKRYPHFHVMLTVNHYSYIHFDLYTMRAHLEVMFKGLDRLQQYDTNPRKFALINDSGSLFYDPNELPYVDIRLYPQDNFREIAAAYVRKGSGTNLMTAVAQMLGKGS